MKMNNKKITLMYPNFKWADWIDRTSWKTHPYNLGILSATLEDRYDVTLFDGNLNDSSKEDFARMIYETKPGILGISVLTNEYCESGFIAAKIAKETDPSIKVVFGGVHATSLPEFTASNPHVDYVVVGEGEYVLGDLCDFINGKGSFPKKGIAQKKNGKIVNSGRAELIQDLDALPLPSYHKIDFMRYATEIQREEVGGPRAMPYAHTTTSRGCPGGCCFCEVETISGKKPRLRSVESITGELETLIQDYGIKSIMFDDDNLLIDKKRAKTLFKTMIDRGYNLKWNAPALALFRLDEEMIHLMKESGCQYVDVAIESGVERVLKDIIHKPLDLKQGLRMLETLKKYEIDTVANFIVGFPGETWEEIRQNLQFAEEIDVDYVKIAIATPLPNTELYKIAKEKDCLVEGFSFHKHLWTDGWIKTEEFNPQDLKILRAYEWDRINFTNPKKRRKIARMMGVSEARLGEIRKETLRRAHS